MRWEKIPNSDKLLYKFGILTAAFHKMAQIDKGITTNEMWIWQSCCENNKLTRNGILEELAKRGIKCSEKTLDTALPQLVEKGLILVDKVMGAAKAAGYQKIERPGVIIPKEIDSKEWRYSCPKNLRDKIYTETQKSMSIGTARWRKRGGENSIVEWRNQMSRRFENNPLSKGLDFQIVIRKIKKKPKNDILTPEKSA